MKKLFTTIILFSIISFSKFGADSAWAGSGYYVGLDLARNLAKISINNSSISSPGATPINVQTSSDSNSYDYGLRLGYKHRISKYGFIAPEFFYSKVNKSDYLYSTTMKAGIEAGRVAFFGSLGYTENNYFNGSSENYGGGVEFKINDNFSISTEYIKYGNITTNETSTSGTITSNTRKNSQLETFKFGITYYFHE